MHLKNRKLTWTIVSLILIIVSSAVLLINWTSFGGTVSGDRLKKVKASPHFIDGKFANTLPHPPLELGDVWGYLIEQFFGDQVRSPPSAIPVSSISSISPTILQNLSPSELRAIWLGHSSVYVEIEGLRLLVDPVFSTHASPFSSFGPKRFHAPPIALIDLPHIDAVLISHDHYDHLDMPTVQYLSSKGTHFFVPLGVGSHLDKWGIPKHQITELDWWESSTIKDLLIVCTPAQHYSSRGFFDYKKSLWSSWVLKGTEYRVFYSGDTGYSDHFKQIGDQLGPFDLGIMRIGQYGPGASWIYSNMDPEDAVKANRAVQAVRMLPVHWGTFNLAFHNWDDPIKRAVKAAHEQDVKLVTPRVGEIIIPNEPLNPDRWWEEVR